MAKIEDGILGGFRGKVGPVIGYRWRDRWCVRARPVHVHNPRTAAQTAHRALFREMVQLAASLKEGLRYGLRAMAAREGMTEMNAFCRLNWQEGGRPAWERLRVSEGPVAAVGVSGARLEGDVLRVEFERGAARGGGGGADGVRLLVYNAARRGSLLTAATERRRGSLAVALPTGWAAEELHVYTFAQDAAGRCSGSEYVRLQPLDEPPAAGLEEKKSTMSVKKCIFAGENKSEMKRQDKDNVLNIIRTTVRRGEPDAEIILYGSRARGDAREDSDWDVIVLLNKPEMRHSDRYEIACDLWEEGFDIGEEINAFVYTHAQWNAAPPSLFKYNVREEGIRL